MSKGVLKALGSPALLDAPHLSLPCLPCMPWQTLRVVAEFVYYSCRFGFEFLARRLSRAAVRERSVCALSVSDTLNLGTAHAQDDQRHIVEH